jgi:hypothetical protein
MTGCVATAMAQLMYYFRFPQSGSGSYSYTHSVYGDIAADFENVHYNYAAMVDKPNKVNPAISLLTSHCGTSVDMEYGPTSSGMYNHKAAYALKTYFNFSPLTQYVFRDSTSLDWDSLIKTHLDNKIPLYYAGWSVPDTNGHAFICDAYHVDTNGNDYYHFNFGWDGSNDGYFYTNPLLGNSIAYHMSEEIIINACPDTTNPIYPSQPPLTGTTTLTEATGSFTDGTIYDCPPNMDYTWFVKPDVDDVTGIQFSMQYKLAENDTIFVTSPKGNFNSIFTHDASTFSVNVTDTEITLRLKTTNQSTPSGGFSASYTTTNKKYCIGGITDYTTSSGAFGDGSGNSRYNNYSNCRYRIITNDAKYITVCFTTFETEKNKDSLSIFDNGARSVSLLMTLSGIHTDSVYTFNTNSLFFSFETDEQNVYSGWELTYKTDVSEREDSLRRVNISPSDNDNRFSIYPNPATNCLYITVGDLSHEGQIQLFDVSGRLLLTHAVHGTKTIVNLNDLVAGMYVVKIVDGNRICYTKTVIKD